MGKAARIAFLGLAVLLMCRAGGAVAAETALPLENLGLRYYAEQGEVCLTRERLPEEGLSRLKVERETALAAMERDGSWLVALREDGRQVSLCVLPAPEGFSASDVSALNAEEREALLLTLARGQAAHDAVWLEDAPDYALCESSLTGGALDIHTLSLNTLYLGKIVSLRMEIVGRGVTEADREALRDAAGRTLRLGAASGAGERELETPEMPVLTTETAAVERKGDGVELKLDPPPATVGGNVVTLSGTTDARAKLRYEVNDSGSYAFVPEKDGSFSVTARNLKDGQDNRVTVTARLDGASASASFTVGVDRQDTPLEISPTSGASFADSFEIRGVTLPGAEVEVLKGSRAVAPQVDENGRFSFTLNTRKQGNYSFTVRATYPGFRQTEAKGMIRRQSEAGAQKAASKLEYDALVAKPESYADTAVLLEGEVKGLAYEAGQPLCLLETAAKEKYLYLCGNLLDLELGQPARLLGVLTGETLKFGGAETPTVELQAAIPLT